MTAPAALSLALSLRARPAAVRQVNHSTLPEGMTMLLAIAAGDLEALQDAQSETGQTEETLREAASFFIEQLLFTPQADAYRILGATPDASRQELRRHMVLLMRWLHPDRHDGATAFSGISRTVFSRRITQAWQELKTAERRVAYDQRLNGHTPQAAPDVSKAVRESSRAHPLERSDTASSKRAPAKRSVRRRVPRLVMYPIARDTLVTRLLQYLRVRP